MAKNDDLAEGLQVSDSEIKSRIIAAATSYEGPLPPAAELKNYDLVMPGLAERIVTSWIDESSHRRELDRTDQRSFYKLAFRGQWLAATLALVIFAGSLYLVREGHDLVGMSMVLAEIAALCWAFVVGRRSPAEPGKALAKAGEEADA